jgi:hypothetical protein
MTGRAHARGLEIFGGTLLTFRMLPSFDCGDHLHPSDLGYRRMGDCIDLALFD